MARHQSTQDILAAARRRNEDRMAAVERIVGEVGTRAGIAQAERDLEVLLQRAQQMVEEAKARDAAAYADALKAGWTERELRAVGIRPLDVKHPAVKAAAARSRTRRQKPAGGDVGDQVDRAFGDQLEAAVHDGQPVT